MHTLEDRMKAVSLYLKYDRRSTAVRRELGYPSDSALRSWVEEFEATGTLHDKYRARAPKYSSQEKQVAVDCYLEHGRNMSRAIEVLGYPGRGTLKQWLDEAIPDRRGLRTRRSPRAKSEFKGEQKQAAVLDLCFRSGTVQEIAEKHGTSRSSLYKWRYELLGKERSMTKSKREESRLENDKRELLLEMELLKAQVEELTKQVHRLQLERDILEVTAELLKKEKGADPKRLSNREKARTIGALRDRYPLNEHESHRIPAESGLCYIKQVQENVRTPPDLSFHSEKKQWDPGVGGAVCKKPARGVTASALADKQDHGKKHLLSANTTARSQAQNLLPQW